MSLLTSFLQLFKWDTSDENDLEQQFDIDKAMNDNWDKLDEAIEDLDTNKVDKVDGKGLSTNDFTNEDKAKLDGLNNYDDTEIKQEIEDIQEEQTKQNEDIEDLKQINAKQDDLIQKLKDNSINVTTEEATSLHVENASTVPAKLEVRGNCKQETREGYSIWNYLDFVLNSAGGLTIDKDYKNGYVTVNGTPNVSYVNLGSAQYITDLLEDGQIYTLWQENYSDTAYGGVYLQVSQNPKAGSEGSQTHYESSKGKKTFTVDKSLYNYVVTLQTGSIATAGTFNNYKNRYMLYKGTDEKSYELPGASPSLDYPSPVRALGDNINILPNKATSKKVYEIEWTVNEDGSVHAKGTAIENETLYLVGNDYKQEAFRFKANKRYKNVSNCDILYRKTDGNYGRLIKDTVYSFNEDLICGLVYLIVDAGQTVDETYYPKIVEYYEGIDESYSKYGQGSAEVRQLTNNVIDMSKATARYNTEITEIDEEKGIIKVHRTNTQDPSIRIFCNLPVGQYTMLHNNHNFGQISIYGKNRIVDIGSEKYKTFNATENITDIRIYSGSELDTDYEINFSDIILVRGNVSREKISYVQYQEQAYIIPIQQPMLQGDYFEKETDGWKEVHTWNKAVLTGNENWSSQGMSSGLWCYFLIDNMYKTDSITGAYCNIATEKNSSEAYNSSTFCFATTVSGNLAFKVTQYTQLSQWKEYLSQQNTSGNPIYVYYKLATQTKLPCTEAQSNVLDQLNELELFKGTNNIITVEDLALMQMTYTVDTKAYIDSKIANTNAQILNN